VESCSRRLTLGLDLRESRRPRSSMLEEVSRLLARWEWRMVLLILSVSRPLHLILLRLELAVSESRSFELIWRVVSLPSSPPFLRIRRHHASSRSSRHPHPPLLPSRPHHLSYSPPHPRSRASLLPHHPRELSSRRSHRRSTKRPLHVQHSTGSPQRRQGHHSRTTSTYRQLAGRGRMAVCQCDGEEEGNGGRDGSIGEGWSRGCAYYEAG